MMILDDMVLFGEHIVGVVNIYVLLCTAEHVNSVQKSHGAVVKPFIYIIIRADSSPSYPPTCLGDRLRTMTKTTITKIFYILYFIISSSFYILYIGPPTLRRRSYGITTVS